MTKHNFFKHVALVVIVCTALHFAEQQQIGDCVTTHLTWLPSKTISMTTETESRSVSKNDSFMYCENTALHHLYHDDLRRLHSNTFVASEEYARKNNLNYLCGKHEDGTLHCPVDKDNLMKQDSKNILRQTGQRDENLCCEATKAFRSITELVDPQNETKSYPLSKFSIESLFVREAKCMYEGQKCKTVGKCTQLNGTIYISTKQGGGYAEFPMYCACLK